MRRELKRRKGMVLILLAGAMMLLAAAMGLAVDCTRIVFMRGVWQNRMEAAALAAVLELDGSSNGIERAREAAAVAAEGFGDELEIAFAVEAGGSWEEHPGDPAACRMARVSTKVRVPLTMLRTMVRRDASVFGVTARAAQQKQAPVPAEAIPEAGAWGRRFAEDADYTSRSYAEYASRGRGNGRRLIAGPEGALFLLPAAGGKHPTEAVGAYLQGSRWKGVGDSGYSLAVLVR